MAEDRGGDSPVSMIQGAEWNGRPCKARCVRVLVEGEERQAVEVWDADQAGDQPFYLDNEDGQGYRKVAYGGGSPAYGHRSLYPAEILGEVECERGQTSAGEEDGRDTRRGEDVGVGDGGPGAEISDGAAPPPGHPIETYSRVVVCRKVRRRRAPKAYYPVWSEAAVSDPGRGGKAGEVGKGGRSGGGHTYWISGFAGTQEQAVRLSERVAGALRAGETPTFEDDGGEGIRRIDRAFEEKERERRLARRR